MKTIWNYRILMTVCIVSPLAPAMAAGAASTDNAALLYYQAFLLYEKPDATMEQILDDFRAGKIGSNETIRTHLEKNRRVIDYVVQAANMRHCDWGYDYSQGIDLTLVNLQTVKRISILLTSEARLLAEQGDYQRAWDRCMTALRMALHVADRPLLTYIVAIGTSGLANRTIQAVLATMPHDVETLNRLKIQLSQIQAAFPVLANVLMQESQICATTMRKDKASVVLRVLEQDYSECVIERQRIRAGDEAFFERNRTHWFNAIAALTAVLKSGQPYPQVFAQLNELEKKLTGEAKENPDATFTEFSLGGVGRIYLLVTRLQTHFNAIQTAIDLYTIRAKTGKLPDALPSGSPLDLFSGQPFEYEEVSDHFTLRCRVKEESKKDAANQYEFKIRQ